MFFLWRANKIPIKYDSRYVLRPNSEHEYTPEEVKELQLSSKKCRHFIKYIKIINPDAGEVTFEPYEYQFELLEKFQRHRYNVALCSRQSGKCLQEDSIITIKNKSSGEIQNITIGEFFKNKRLKSYKR